MLKAGVLHVFGNYTIFSKSHLKKILFYEQETQNNITNMCYSHWTLAK